MFLAQRNEAGAEIIVFDVLNLENFADRPAHARGAADRKGHVQAAVGLFEELANRLGYLPVDDQEPGCRRAVAVGLCHIERSPIMVRYKNLAGTKRRFWPIFRVRPIRAGFKTSVSPTK